MTGLRFQRAVIWLLSLASLALGYTSKKPPFLTRQDMCGIWRLSQPTAANANLPSEDGTVVMETSDDIVLRLNDDGTFDPYTTITEEESISSTGPDLRHMLCRGGCWEYQDQTLLLAADRPEQVKSTDNDTLLIGQLLVHVSECLAETTEDPLLEEESIEEEEHPDIDVHLSIPQGEISTGKFMYPKKHKAFFDDPILFQRSNSEREAAENPPVALFHKKDFYNRSFYLTATPHPINPVYAAMDSRYDEEAATMDIRVLPITFYPNNTFAAIGSEKILRGRYGMCGEERERLWFQVSLFGAGRSAPGSVYSEGRLLSKDDQRGYVGNIQAYPNQKNETIMFVEGEFYYGEDLKNPRKTRSWGSFALQETDSLDGEEDNDDDDEEEVADGGSENTVVSWDEEEDAFQ